MQAENLLFPKFIQILFTAPSWGSTGRQYAGFLSNGDLFRFFSSDLAIHVLCFWPGFRLGSHFRAGSCRRSSHFGPSLGSAGRQYAGFLSNGAPFRLFSSDLATHALRFWPGFCLGVPLPGWFLSPKFPFWAFFGQRWSPICWFSFKWRPLPLLFLRSGDPCAPLLAGLLPGGPASGLVLLSPKFPTEKTPEAKADPAADRGFLSGVLVFRI